MCEFICVIVALYSKIRTPSTASRCQILSQLVAAKGEKLRQRHSDQDTQDDNTSSCAWPVAVVKDWVNITFIIVSVRPSSCPVNDCECDVHRAKSHVIDSVQESDGCSREDVRLRAVFTVCITILTSRSSASLSL